MSSSEEAAVPTERVLRDACAALTDALQNPQAVADATFQELVAAAVRLYGLKAESGLRDPFPKTACAVGTDEVMLLATDMLHALNVQLFELSMWQAMTGNMTAPSHRLNETD